MPRRFEHLSDRELLEIIVSTIADLDASVQANTAAVVALQNFLSEGGTVLSTADQATLDADVAAITANTATLTALAQAPAPAPAAA